MKTTTQRTTLLEAISRVIPYVDRSPINPILSNVVLDTGCDAFGLTIRATDLAAFAQTMCEATSSESDRIAINAQTLLSVLKSLPDGEVCIETLRGKTALLTSGDAKFNLAAMNADDMPDRQPVEPTAKFKIAGLDLSRVMKRALAAINPKYPSQACRGVFLQVDDDGLTASGTDGKRLVRMPANVESYSGPDVAEVIIPAEAASSIADSFVGAEMIGVSIGDGRVIFEGERMRVDTSVVGAQYPHVDQIVPSNFKVRLDINLADLRRATAQASVVCVGESNIARLSCSDSGVVVSSAGIECGEFSTAIPVGAYDGDPLDISFDITFLSSLLKLVEGDVVRMNANQPKTPVVFGDPDNPDALLLVMPIVTKAKPEAVAA